MGYKRASLQNVDMNTPDPNCIALFSQPSHKSNINEQDTGSDQLANMT